MMREAFVYRIDRRDILVGVSPNWTAFARANAWVSGSSTILRTVSREPVNALDIGLPRTDQLLRICSICKKVAMEGPAWVELEQALSHLRRSDAACRPELAHGICPDCSRAALGEIDDLLPPGGRPRGEAADA